MKRILFLIHDLHYGGAEKVLVNLVNCLDKTKYDVTVRTLFDTGHNRQYLNKDVKYIGGFKRMFPGNVTLMNLFSPKTLCKLVIKDNYDIVISFLEGPSARIVSAYNGKKVAWIHTDFFNKELAASGFRNFDESKKCYSEFDRIIAVSDVVKTDFDKIFGFNDFVQVLYNVNDSNRIKMLADESQNYIEKSDNCFNIISVGKLDISTKGFDNLIHVHKMLLDKDINNKVYIVGEGPDRVELESLINELGVYNTCKLIGFDENPYKYVSKADLFVCSSHREGFSTAVTEALILGIPVVSTNVSGAVELLGEHDQYGIVTNDDINDLFESVYSVLSNIDMLSKYRDCASVRGNYFSAEKTTKAVEKMFEDVLINES